jgi:hypothetical protein
MKRNVHKRIACCFLVVSALQLSSPSAFAWDNNSARIRSLGGYSVSGIIPDFLTDLSLNPAYGRYASGLSINYGHRTVSARIIPFNILYSRYSDIDLTQPSMPTIYSATNLSELTAYGLKRAGWTFALTSEWRISDSDDGYPGYRRYSRTDGYEDHYTTVNGTDDFDYWRLAISAAREIWGEYAIGIRLGGGEHYFNELSRIKVLRQEYYHDDELSDYYLYREESNVDFEAHTARWRSAFLQIGLVHDNDGRKRGGLNFTVSRNPIEHSRHQYDQNIYRRYDTDAEIIRYEYKRVEWRDRADGNLWTFSLQGRYLTPSKTGIFIGGSYEFAAYASDWKSSDMDYNWYEGFYSSDRGALTGDGDSKQVSLFTKVGKTFAIHDKIDLTIGVHGSYSRSWSHDRSESRYDGVIESLPDREELSSSDRSDFKTEKNHFYLSCPAALELRASDYFSCYACFYTYLAWDREMINAEMPSFLKTMGYPIINMSRSGGHAGGALDSSIESNLIRKSEDSISTSRAATFGFTLHYNDRLFVDVYTGSDLTPDSLDGMVVDLRYKF